MTTTAKSECRRRLPRQARQAQRSGTQVDAPPQRNSAVRLCVVAPLLVLAIGAPISAAASPITPVTYYFSGTLTDASDNLDLSMPGVEVGTAFVGAMAISAYSGSETISEADLWLKAGDQIVTARSIGEDPLASFANYTALGPMFSPTIQNAYIENVFFSLTGGGAYGSIGIWVVGQDPVFGMHFDHAIGSIDSLTAAPEPMTGTLTLLGLGMLAIRRISDKRAHLLRSSIRPEV